jgi:hypothetical protein
MSEILIRDATPPTPRFVRIADIASIEHIINLDHVIYIEAGEDVSAICMSNSDSIRVADHRAGEIADFLIARGLMVRNLSAAQPGGET